ncbi:MAG: rhamnulokinase [Christensenellales bacterium]
MKHQALAIDLGAGSGRLWMGSYNEGKISLEEVYRFSNDPVYVGERFYFDYLRLLHEMKTGLQIADKAYPDYSTIGIDTWGCTYMLLDDDGDVVGNRYHTRDTITLRYIDQVFKRIPRKDLYMMTGKQYLHQNVIFQLVQLQYRCPGILNSATHMVMLPSFFDYAFTGQYFSELTNASTTHLFDSVKRDWSWDIIDKMGFSRKMFPSIKMPGSEIGMLSKELCAELKIKERKVVAVCSHDTSSAIAAIPQKDDDYIFISSGTWSLVGVEAKQPLVNESTYRHNLTNESCYGGNTQFIKQMNGMWHIQQLREQLSKRGTAMSYQQINNEAAAAAPFLAKIFPDWVGFFLSEEKSTLDYLECLQELCMQTGQEIPKTPGEFARTIYESLAFAYRYIKDIIESVTMKKYARICIIGGGSQCEILNQFTANVLNLPVYAGPVEASSLGNIIVQFIAQGVFADLSEARSAVKRSTGQTIYYPQNHLEWNEKYQDYLKMISQLKSEFD